MGRQKDLTEHKCKICGSEMTVAGLPSHLYRKHNGMSSDEYAKSYGEFRKKYLQQGKRQEASKIRCKECNIPLASHKQLIHHINKFHNGWEKYFIKHFFKGIHPVCECGCGQKVKLLRNGKDENGKPAYARSFITGHSTKTRLPGYRVNNDTQKLKMRSAAIKRMQNKEGSYFNNGPSREEIEVYKFLKNLGIQVEIGNREILSGLEIDIYLPEYKIGIEYNGGYFHSDIFKKKKYHLSKTIECESKGIRLIHIWEADWYTSPDKVKSLLKNILGKTSRKVYGRNTIVKELDFKTTKNFLEENHLQGNSVSKVRLGLFHKDELLSVMTFSGLRSATGRKSKEGSYELVRFCNKLDTQVLGGGSKLLSYFKVKYNPLFILSYANRDWSVGNFYDKIGMTLIGNTQPGYFYVKSKYKFSRFQFQKHKLIQDGADPMLTEYEIMSEKGYYRVWDTGNLIYEWNINTNT